MDHDDAPKPLTRTLTFMATQGMQDQLDTLKPRYSLPGRIAPRGYVIRRVLEVGLEAVEQGDVETPPYIPEDAAGHVAAGTPDAVAGEPQPVPADAAQGGAPAVDEEAHDDR